MSADPGLKMLTDSLGGIPDGRFASPGEQAQGRGGVKDLLLRMVLWRVAPQAYAMAIGIPVVITGVAIALTGMGGAWEEPGFRGFALGRLERRFGLATAPLLLGGFWVLRHLPLFVTGDILWPDVVVIMAVSVVIAAVYHSARESILIAMLLHATNNTVGGELASPLFVGADAVHLHLFNALGWVVAAVVVLGSRRARQHGAVAIGSSVPRLGRERIVPLTGRRRTWSGSTP